MSYLLLFPAPTSNDVARRCAGSQNNITRSKAEAIDTLKAYGEDIKNAPDPAKKFAELASVHSDCSSHAQFGDLGWFGKGQMQKPFEEATYGLEKGKISGVVETESGVHLILRTA